MTFNDLGTTNVWLALIAISSVVQLLMVVGLLVGAVRFSRRVEKTIERINLEHLAPLAARAHHVIDQAEEVIARVRTVDDSVRLEVRDHGRGLPAGDSDALFERFWRSEGGRERGKGGAGLGLAIVAGIVAAHGGTVSAENAPDGGAVFTVRLPPR